MILDPIKAVTARQNLWNLDIKITISDNCKHKRDDSVRQEEKINP